jgi:hypothetical protein
MSPISQLRDCFPNHDMGILTQALEAAKDDVQKAADFLMSNFASLDAESSSSGARHATISASRINVAEKRLANPAFRQPLKQPQTKLNLTHLIRKQESVSALANDKIVKEETDTAKPLTIDKIKPEPAEDDQLNTIPKASTPIITKYLGSQEVIDLTESDSGEESEEEDFPDDEPSSVIQPSTSNGDYAGRLEFLMGIFPAADRKECEDVIGRCNGDAQKAYEMMEALRPRDLIPDVSPVERAPPGDEEDDYFPGLGIGGKASKIPRSHDEELKIARSEKRHADSESDSPVSIPFSY